MSYLGNLPVPLNAVTGTDIVDGSIAEADLATALADKINNAVQPTDTGVFASTDQGALADSAVQPNTSATLNELTATNYVNTVYTLTGDDLDAANGNLQVKSFGSSNVTLTSSLVSGESITLLLEGTGAVTFPTISWSGGEAPTLETTGQNIIVLFQEGSTLYGAYVGVA